MKNEERIALIMERQTEALERIAYAVDELLAMARYEVEDEDSIGNGASHDS